MKKLFAIMLALMLVLTMGSALAEGVTPSEAKVLEFKKIYTTTAGETPATIPSETLSFTVEAAAGNPDTTMISIEDTVVSASPATITINVPAYDKVGKYNYTVKENAGNTQGVTYSQSEFGVQVFVAYDDNNPNQLVSTVSFTTKVGDTTEKVDSITNYYDLGTLTVTKTVTGNLASHTQQFNIDVTFHAENAVKSQITGAATINASDWVADDVNGGYSVTKTVQLAHDDVATFSNIPAGVTYTVTEQAQHTAADATGSNAAAGYTVKYKVGNEEKNSGTITADTTSAVSVENSKGAEVETGITTDNLPYIVLMGIVVLAGVAMIAKRRMAHND